MLQLLPLWTLMEIKPVIQPADPPEIARTCNAMDSMSDASLVLREPADESQPKAREQHDAGAEQYD